MVEAQGGDSNALESIVQRHTAPIVRDIPAPHAGRIAKMDAGSIGRASVALGAGRTKATDPVDFAVGFNGIQKVGISIEAGAPLLRIHARDEPSLHRALALLEGALVVEP
jgi:thymidine phosphorylase